MSEEQQPQTIKLAICINKFLTVEKQQTAKSPSPSKSPFWGGHFLYPVEAEASTHVDATTKSLILFFYYTSLVYIVCLFLVGFMFMPMSIIFIFIYI